MDGGRTTGFEERLRMKIAMIGTGNIGGTLARKFAGAGHDIHLVNSRGPHTLEALAGQIGATAATPDAALKGADAVIFSLPYKAFLNLPERFLADAAADTLVIDTGNYYPMRDGRIEGLDGVLSDSEWVARRLGRPVVKLFNSISANSLKSKGKAADEPGRIALPVSGDDPDAKQTAVRLADEAGFDAIDAGPLSQSWRQQPGTGAYTTDLDAHHLRLALDRLDDADRKRLPERRDSNLKMILALPDGPGSDQSVRALRRQWDLPEDI